MDDDLTASHWDDVISPSSQDFLSSNHFTSLALEDPYRDSHAESEPDYKDQKGQEEEKEEEDEQDKAKDNDEQLQPRTFESPMLHNITLFGVQSSFLLLYLPQFPAPAVSEYEAEERRRHRAAIVDQLTSGVDELDLDSASRAPVTVDSSLALFTDKGSPTKVDRSTSPVHYPQTQTTTSAAKSAKFRTKRIRKYPLSTIATHLAGESAPIHDPLLSASSESAASILKASGSGDKQKELLDGMDAPLYDVLHKNDASSDNVGLTNEFPSGDDDRSGTDVQFDLKKLPKTTKIAKSALGPSDNHLQIAVGDPVKVGDITTAHIVYALRTINRNLELSHFPSPEATVSRRYRDFRWIYRQLQNNHPGKIIPPPPSKQTYIGRFNENFVENRRLLLEKMLAKICKVPCLVNDPDFAMFLTSTDFATDSKERESSSGSAASHAGLGDDDLDTPASAVVTNGGGPRGFISSLFSIAPKIPEPDEFFAQKKSYAEDLEFNLMTFLKSLEMIAAQRVEAMSVEEELAKTVEELADIEILKKTTDLLSAFVEVHTKLKENLDRVNLQDQLTLGFTIEEYLRIIGSVMYTFEARTRIYQQLYTFQQELARKKESLERTSNRYKSSVDKINMLKFEVDKLQQKVAYFENSFKNISETIRGELNTFEMEKIDDFRNSVEIFIESSIESQKEAIELWETFYERHNLAAF